MKLFKIIFPIFFVIFCFNICVAQTPSQTTDNKSPDDIVTRLYELVTFDSTATPNGDQVKSLFIDEAVIVLRTTRDSMSVLDKHEFVELFIRDSKKYHFDKTGFQEKIINPALFIIFIKVAG